MQVISSSNLLTRFDDVGAESLPKESKSVQSSDIPVVSPKREIDYEKSLYESVSQEVSKTGESNEDLAPEFK